MVRILDLRTQTHLDPEPEHWLHKQFFLEFLTTVESDLRSHGRFHFLKPINQFIEPMRPVIEIEAIVCNAQYCREISLSKTSTIWYVWKHGEDPDPVIFLASDPEVDPFSFFYFGLSSDLEHDPVFFELLRVWWKRFRILTTTNKPIYNPTKV